MRSDSFSRFSGSALVLARRRASMLLPLCFVIALLAAGATSVTVHRAFAAEASAVEAVSRELMDPCENCKGKLLSACDCGPAAELKTEVAQLLDQGLAPKAVVEKIVSEKGEWVRAAPPKRGFNLIGYALPFVLILLGAGFLVLFLRRAVMPQETPRAIPRIVPAPETADAIERRPANLASPGVEDEARYRKLLEQELKRMES